MSKREIRAKRLVAAVLLAISVQMWSAPPLWAAEASVQTETSAAGEAKETKDAKAADSETGGEADADEGENVVVPVIGYSTRSAAGSDYGVMPLADMAVDGALTGVTGINGSELVVDKVNNNFFIGTIQDGGSFDKSSKNNAAIGLDIYVDSNGNSSVFGAAAKSWGESASVFGAGAESGEYGSVFGAGAEASEQYGSAFGAGALAGHSNTVAFGYSAKSTEWYSIAVGAEAKAEVTGGIAIGALANVGTGVKTYGSGIAIGMEAHTNNDLTIALGYNAESTFESSIAVGANSATTAAYQVAFGTGEVKTVDGAEVVTWTDRRSLAGISDIDMEGALTGVNKIDMKNGALTGVSTINGNVLVPMNEDVTNKSLAIGTGADFKSSYSSVTRIYKNAIAIGNGAYAGGNGSLAIGFDSNGNAASAGGVGSISLNAMASGDHNVIISGWADAYDSVVIGYGSSTDNSNVVAIGNGSYGGADGTVLGYAAGTDGRNSVAIGAKSSVASGDDDKVSFGHKVGDTNYADGSDYSDDLFRSLINVADIDMHGALTGVTGIDGVTVSGTDASTGLTVGGNAVIGKTDTPFSSTGFAVAKDGAVTAKTVNGATITGTGFNGVTLSTDGKVNGAVITSNSFNGVTLEKGADSHYKVGGVDVTKMQTDVAGKADAATTLTGYGITDAYTKTETDTAIGKKADKATTLTGYGIADAYTKTETDTAIGKKADKATTLAGYGIADAYTKTETDTAIGKKADKATTLTGYGIADAYTKTETDTAIGKKADKATTLTGYGIADAYTKTETDTAIGKKADKATTLTGYGITDAYTKTAADAKITAATADMATKTQVTADIGTAKTALENAYQAADTALSDRAAALETKTAKFNTAGDNLTGMANITSTAATLGGVGFASAGVMTGVASIDGIAIDASRNLSNAGTYNGVDVSALKEAVDGISADGVGTADTAGIKRDTASATTTIETNTKISSSGITTNAVTASGTVKAGEFVEGSQKLSDKYAAKTALADYTTTTDMNTKLADYATTTAVDTKLADYAKSDSVYSKAAADTAFAKAGDVDTLKTTIGDSTTGLAAVNTKVGALDTAYQAADTQIRTDFAAADTALKTELNTAIDEKAKKATDLAGYGITDAYTKNDADAKITAATADMATKTQLTADIGTAKTALENAYKAADTQIRTDFAAADTALSDRAAALETAATGMTYDADKATTTFAGGVTATVLTAGELKVGATGFGFGSDGALTAKTVNGIEIKKDGAAVKVGGIDLTALSKGDVVTDNTKGIDRNQDTATTTIETNTKISSSGITTNAVTASGTVKASEFVEGDKKLSDKYAAKTALDDYTTTTDMNTKLADYATTTAVDTKLADYAKSDSVYSKAAADTAFAKADASNLPSDVSGWQSKLGISDISSKLAGFSYDNTSGTTTIGGVKLKGGTLADVKSLNGKAVGADSKGITIDGIGLKDLSERVTAIENNGGGGTGGSTADTEGIKRTDVADGSGKTTVEGATSFTKDGLKTANLEATTAALGGVNFAAGAVTGVSSINGVVFGSDGKIGGVSLSGGKVDGVDVGWLDQRVKSLEDNGTGGGGTGGGGSSANTSGIHKPDRDTTNIEGNTSITTDGIDTNKVNASDSIVVADGEKNKTVISKDGILVAEGEKNQVKINEDGIHVGKNSSVVNDTDGFITDKGLYIGVSSSSDTSTAKFSVAPNGNLSSKAGDYGFSNTSADGAKFTHSGDTAYGTGSQLDTTIQGNKVTTGRIDTDELYVDGNKVTVAGGTIGQTDAVNNHLSGADADGNTVTNDFKTSAVNGTTQAAEKTSADGKESTKTINNTSAGGTGVTTSKTTTDSKDNVTVKESSFGTNEKGMTLSTSNKVTDKDGKVTKDTSGTTTMTGDSISVSKTTTTTEKDADGNEKEVTKTSGTTIGSGEVTLKREDGSTIEVGSAIEGMQSDMRELDGRVNRMGVEIKEVGALSAALAGLHPQPENANSRADFAMAMGSYEGKQALAVGGFYRPDKRTMLSIGASTTSSKHMMNMGISIALDRLPEAERRAKEAAKAAGVEQETLNRVLERLAALEQDNRRLQADNEKRDVAYEKLAADYTQLKEKYIEETADRQQPEQAEAEE